MSERASLGTFPALEYRSLLEMTIITSSALEVYLSAALYAKNAALWRCPINLRCYLVAYPDGKPDVKSVHKELLGYVLMLY